MSDFEYEPRDAIVQSGPLAGARVRNLTPEEAAARANADTPGVPTPPVRRLDGALSVGERVTLTVHDRTGGEVTIEAVLLAADPEDDGGVPVLHVTVDPASGVYPHAVRVYAGEAEEPDIEYRGGVWL